MEDNRPRNTTRLTKVTADDLFDSYDSERFDMQLHNSCKSS